MANQRYFAPVSGGTFVGNAAFCIGAADNAGQRYFFDGAIDEVGFFKRFVSTVDRYLLSNTYNGLTYPIQYPVPHT